MTLREAKQMLNVIGIDLRFDRDDNEYRVNFKGGREETAYYTNDLDDAVATAHSIVDHAKDTCSMCGLVYSFCEC